MSCTQWRAHVRTGSRRIERTRTGLVPTSSAVLLFLLITAAASSAQTFTPLFSFPFTSPAQGAGPIRISLIQGQDGLLYGTTSGQGITGYGGTVFNITTDRTLTTLHTFTYCQQPPCPDGSNPYGGVVQDSKGNLYGTTPYGGTANLGTVYKIASDGTFITLYIFCAQTGCPDGSTPQGSLILGADGNLYGATRYGGGASNAGTIFKITTAGKLKTLHIFTSTDGSGPLGIMQAANGTFYGVTYQGGTFNDGTLFKMTASGVVTTLHSFCNATSCPDGANPNMAMIQGKDGNFYGATTQGGKYSEGTIYKMNASGALSTIYNFCAIAGCPDGATPLGGVIQATDGNLYGTTYMDGTNGGGTIFEITTSGALTTLYQFCAALFCDDGASPFGGLLEDTNGILYGTTITGGTGGVGTVFSMSIPSLVPFLTASPTAGKVGTKVILLGSNLTGATVVSFNGTPATFAMSGESIDTTVPPGATTGAIQVTTPTGPLSTNTSFKVIPQIKSFTPPSGPVGTSVTITGMSLTQTSKVTFGGVKATSFTVNSDTQVTATVPTGAKTGKIVITTPGGTAASSTTFTVM